MFIRTPKKAFGAKNELFLKMCVIITYTMMWYTIMIMRCTCYIHPEKSGICLDLSFSIL